MAVNTWRSEARGGNACWRCDKGNYYGRGKCDNADCPRYRNCPMRWCRWCGGQTYVGRGWCLSRTCQRETGTQRNEDGEASARGWGESWGERAWEGEEPTVLLESRTRQEGQQWDRGLGWEKGVREIAEPIAIIESGFMKGRRSGNTPKEGGRLLVGGHKVWQEFEEAAGLREVEKIILLDNNGVLNRLHWRQAVEVGIDLDHATSREGRETRLLMCSFAKNDKWAQRVMDSFETLPAMVALDGFVFVDSREAGNGPIVAERVVGKPKQWVWLTGGDKSAVSRLTGKPTLLFDDKRKVLREHGKGNGANEGVHCMMGGGEGQGIWEEGRREFQVAWTADMWVEYVQRFLDR